MLKHPTLDQLHALGLQGMAKAFVENAANGGAGCARPSRMARAAFGSEASWRQDKRFAARLRYAKLRDQACVREDVDSRSPRGLDRALFQKLIEGEWIDNHDNLALIGTDGRREEFGWPPRSPHKACRDNQSVLCGRGSRAIRRPRAGARRWPLSPGSCAISVRVELLILDNWGLEQARRRCPSRSPGNPRRALQSPLDRGSLPASHGDRWHELIADPTYADAILDRLVHNAHRIELAGESLRRTKERQTRKA